MGITHKAESHTLINWTKLTQKLIKKNLSLFESLNMLKALKITFKTETRYRRQRTRSYGGVPRQRQSSIPGENYDLQNEIKKLRQELEMSHQNQE